MKKILAFIRLLGVAVIIFGYLIPIILGVLMLKKDLTWTMKRRQGITQALVWWLNIRIQASGTPQDGNFLFISNHRSYLDPIVTACFVSFLPVGKAEVSQWPLIGFGAKVTGVVFVKREDKNSRLDTRNAVREALKKGHPVLIYPEGTTTDEPKMRPFRGATFQIAAEEGIAVVPIAIEYAEKTDAWIGADTFIPHFLRCFGKWRTDVFIHFGTPISESDGEVLKTKTQTVIDAQLIDFQKYR